jgi:hypothetical protein
VCSTDIVVGVSAAVGRIIPSIAEVLDVVVQAHVVVAPDLPLIGWDVALTSGKTQLSRLDRLSAACQRLARPLARAWQAVCSFKILLLHVEQELCAACMLWGGAQTSPMQQTATCKLSHSSARRCWVGNRYSCC